MSKSNHDVPDDLLSSLLANYKKPEDLIGENGLLKQLTKLLVEKALDAEMTEHLGHDRHAPVANPAGNARNGRSRKTLKGEFGELPIEVPRDRQVRIKGVAGMSPPVVLVDLGQSNVGEAGDAICAQAVSWLRRPLSGEVLRIQRYRGNQPASEAGELACP